MAPCRQERWEVPGKGQENTTNSWVWLPARGSVVWGCFREGFLSFAGCGGRAQQGKEDFSASSLEFPLIFPWLDSHCGGAAQLIPVVFIPCFRCEVYVLPKPLPSGIEHKINQESLWIGGILLHIVNNWEKFLQELPPGAAAMVCVPRWEKTSYSGET